MNPIRFSSSWQSRTALFVATGLVSTLVLPLGMGRALAQSIDSTSAPYLIGQRFPDSWRNSLPAGLVIPVSYEKAEKIVLSPEETVPVTFEVAANITNSRGQVIIPAGSELEGELQPQSGGSQFVAQTLILPDGTRRDINAASNVVTETETITERDDPNILRGAVVGGAAAAILSEIFGSIDVIEVLAGAGVGTLAEIFLLRGKREVEVNVVYPEDLEVRLQSDFVP